MVSGEALFQRRACHRGGSKKSDLLATESEGKPEEEDTPEEEGGHTRGLMCLR